MNTIKLIIDGYNLLKHIVGADHVNERERVAFIEKVARYAHIKQLPIVLVFDGGPSIYPTREKHNGVEVIYSGTKESADEYIQQYVQDVPVHNLMLISTDRQLVNFVNYYGVDALDSQAFYGFMQEALVEPEVPPIVCRVPGAAKKLHPEESNRELDALMQEAAEVILRKPDDIASSYQPTETKQKVAKKERLRAQKLKKL